MLKPLACNWTSAAAVFGSVCMVSCAHPCHTCIQVFISLLLTVPLLKAFGFACHLSDVLMHTCEYDSTHV